MKTETKIVGKRVEISKPSREAINRFFATVSALRNGKPICPKGLFRFKTFEEADAWLTKMIAKT